MYLIFMSLSCMFLIKTNCIIILGSTMTSQQLSLQMPHLYFIPYIDLTWVVFTFLWLLWHNPSQPRQDADSLLFPTDYITNIKFVFADTRKLDITPILRSLHWFPVSQRIYFKIFLLVFKALDQKHIQNSLVSYEASRPFRSSVTDLLCVPRTTESEAAFSYYAPVEPTSWFPEVCSICHLI